MRHSYWLAAVAGRTLLSRQGLRGFREILMRLFQMPANGE